MVGLHHIGILKSERRKSWAQSTETQPLLINCPFRGLSTYNVIINNQLQRKKNPNILTNVLFFGTEEKEKNSSNKFPVTCTVPFSVTSGSPFGLFASDGP